MRYRRDVLAGIVATAGTALAGCIGDGGGDGASVATPSPTPADTPTPTPTPGEEPLTNPVTIDAMPMVVHDAPVDDELRWAIEATEPTKLIIEGDIPDDFRDRVAVHVDDTVYDGWDLPAVEVIEVGEWEVWADVSAPDALELRIEAHPPERIHPAETLGEALEVIDLSALPTGVEVQGHGGERVDRLLYPEEDITVSVRVDERGEHAPIVGIRYYDPSDASWTYPDGAEMYADSAYAHRFQEPDVVEWTVAGGRTYWLMSNHVDHIDVSVERSE